MRTFYKFPEKKVCPICNTNKEGDCCLVSIHGTQEGLTVQAEVFHLDCLELWYNKEHGLIFQKIKDKV